MKKKILQLLFKEEGVTSIEYALIAGLIVIALAIGVPNVGAVVKTMYQTLADSFPTF